jgi:hypothetical protein
MDELDDDLKRANSSARTSSPSSRIVQIPYVTVFYGFGTGVAVTLLCSVPGVNNLGRARASRAARNGIVALTVYDGEGRVDCSIGQTWCHVV